MDRSLSILSAISERATLVVIVTILVLAIAGVPRSKTRYRALLISLTVFSLFAVCQWYILFAVGTYYAHATQWVPLGLVIAFALAFVCGLIESVSLWWFKRRADAQNKNA
jgi:hypothetical protein